MGFVAAHAEMFPHVPFFYACSVYYESFGVALLIDFYPRFNQSNMSLPPPRTLIPMAEPFLTELIYLHGIADTRRR